MIGLLPTPESSPYDGTDIRGICRTFLVFFFKIISLFSFHLIFLQFVAFPEIPGNSFFLIYSWLVVMFNYSGKAGENSSQCWLGATLRLKWRDRGRPQLSESSGIAGPCATPASCESPCSADLPGISEYCHWATLITGPQRQRPQHLPGTTGRLDPGPLPLPRPRRRLRDSLPANRRRY